MRSLMNAQNEIDKRRADLKDRLFEDVSSYQYINDFFRQLLEKIVEKDSNWISNALVILILRRHLLNLNTINIWLETICKYNKGLFGSLRNQIDSSDNQFDKMIKGLFAEIRAACWLIKRGFEGIEKVKRESKVRTPDFAASKDKIRYVAEVKNLAAPSELFELLGTAVEGDSLLYPHLYENRNLAFKITPTDFVGDPVDNQDEIAIGKFVVELRTCLIAKKRAVTYRYQKTIDGEAATKSIECSVLPSTSFDYSIQFMDWLPCLYDLEKFRPFLLPLIRKTCRVLLTDERNAIDQLVKYDPDNQYEKVVLLNWHETSLFKLDNCASAAYSRAILHLDKTIKEYNAKISIVLLED